MNATAAVLANSAAAASKTHRKLELLQCFRGLAAISVLLFHVAVIARERAHFSFFWHFLRPGSTGVDFFFVLSGFIIFWVHGRDVGQSWRLQVYSWRRLVRVYPLYALVTLAVLPLYIAGFGKAGKLTGKLALQSLTLLPLPPGQQPIVGQGWTLVHEALFYLLFGCFIVLGTRWALGVSSILIAGSVAQLAMGLSGSSLPGPYWIAGWIFSPYNLEFAAGCAAALLALHLPNRTICWLLPAGLVLLACVWTIPSQDPNEVLAPDVRLASKMVLLFGLPYMLITAGSVAFETHFRTRAPRFLLAIGDATYSIYLTHFVILSGLSAVTFRFVRGPGQRTWYLTLCACAAIALGYLIHRFVESQCSIVCGGPRNILHSPAPRGFTGTLAR